jgi:hypothetical protein
LLDVGLGEQMVLSDQYFTEVVNFVYAQHNTFASYKAIKWRYFSPANIFNHAVPGELVRILLQILFPKGHIIADTETIGVVENNTLLFQGRILVVSPVLFVKNV